MCGMLDLSRSAAPSPQPGALHHAVGLSQKNTHTQPLADNFEVYMQKQTAAGALEPDSMTGGNIFMMLSFFFFCEFFPCLLSWEVGSHSLGLLLGVSPLSVRYELKGLAVCVCMFTGVFA